VLFTDDSGGAPIEITLEAGNPRFQQVADSIQAQVLARRTKACDFTCIYNPAQGALVFNYSWEYSLLFADEAAAGLLGFDGSLVHVMGTRTSRALEALPVRSIKVIVSGVNFRNLCSSGNRFSDSAVLACFPVVDLRPYTWLDIVNEQAPSMLSQKTITELRFHLTDWEGNDLTMLPQRQYIQLRVDTVKTFDTTAILLSNILKTLQLTALK
jgi:hypothetical protein